MPRYVVADDEERQSDSSDEEEQAEDQEENGDDEDEQQTAEEAPAAAHDRKKIKLSLKQKQKDVCHVRATFVFSKHDAACCCNSALTESNIWLSETTLEQAIELT